mmetsp:Transcript_1972/g.6181  ORF Transcript_1972/g.6181 Transcript_1972/m.6181 type:complete len:256 (+) Transcript_1972:637-1404(+)
MSCTHWNCPFCVTSNPGLDDVYSTATFLTSTLSEQLPVGQLTLTMSAHGRWNQKTSTLLSLNSSRNFAMAVSSCSVIFGSRNSVTGLNSLATPDVVSKDEWSAVPQTPNRLVPYMRIRPAAAAGLLMLYRLILGSRLGPPPPTRPASYALTKNGPVGQYSTCVPYVASKNDLYSASAACHSIAGFTDTAIVSDIVGVPTGMVIFTFPLNPGRCIEMGIACCIWTATPGSILEMYCSPTAISVSAMTLTGENAPPG